MDMFNRLKQRIAEELESEAEEGPMVDSGDPPEATEVEALRQEVLNLKEHINKNYFVYVKRLEKRKDRIKELEEYARSLASENESAAQKLQKAEGKRPSRKSAWLVVRFSIFKSDKNFGG